MKEFLRRKFDIIICPSCGAVKKHQEWVRLSVDQLVEIALRQDKMCIVHEKCTVCIEVEPC